ncbi:ThiF family adenylyltransferase [Streptomyces sp. bgisy027]|uniref:ThiF family adenylyltransferase n=1 Tax=Streptomyces sp. bgisy027 TaxID=3413770 RepID=UPI003D74D6E5
MLSVRIFDFVLDALDGTLGAVQPEQGGALLGLRGQDVVTSFIHDPTARVTRVEYQNSPWLLEEITRREQAGAERFKGIVHSHPARTPQPSGQDRYEFATALETNPQLGRYIAPIVTHDALSALAQHELRTGRGARISFFCGTFNGPRFALERMRPVVVPLRASVERAGLPFSESSVQVLDDVHGVSVSLPEELFGPGRHLFVTAHFPFTAPVMYDLDSLGGAVVRALPWNLAASPVDRLALALESASSTVGGPPPAEGRQVNGTARTPRTPGDGDTLARGVDRLLAAEGAAQQTGPEPVPSPAAPEPGTTRTSDTLPVTGTGGSLSGTGGPVSGTGGLASDTRGSLPDDSGSVPGTGGSVSAPGGPVSGTGEPASGTGGSVSGTGGHASGTRGAVSGDGGSVSGRGPGPGAAGSVPGARPAPGTSGSVAPTGPARHAEPGVLRRIGAWFGLTGRASLGQALFARTGGLLSPALAGRHVLLVGAGSVGSYLADVLVRSGVGRLTVVDPDRVEAANIGRSLFIAHDIGTPKAKASVRHLRNVHPGVKARAWRASVADIPPKRWRKLLPHVDLVIAATDDNAAQQRLNHLAYWFGTPAVFVGLYQGAAGGEVVFSKPPLPCWACSTGGVRESLGGLGMRPDTDYDTGRSFAVPGLLPDIQHVASSGAKIALALLHGDERDRITCFLAKPLEEQLSMVLMAMEPDHWLFPKVMGEVPGQHAFQSIWVRTGRRPDCPVCGEESRRVDPLEYHSAAKDSATTEQMQQALRARRAVSSPGSH